MGDPVIDINGNLIPEPTDVQILTGDADRRRNRPALADLLPAKSLSLGGWQGRDVSSYDGLGFAMNLDAYMSKATESNNFESSGRLARKARIKGAGKVFGEYHYAQPGNGAAQCDFFLGVAGMPADDEMPVWLDYEVSGLGPAFRDAFCNQYLHRVGVRCGLYTGESMFNTSLGLSKGAAGWMWGAHYGVAAPTYRSKLNVWQWQGGPDLDTFYTSPHDMTVGKNRAKPAVTRGPAGVYPFGPDPKSPYATGPTSGIKPAGSFTIRTWSGQTWDYNLRRYFGGTVNGKLTTDVAALKQWHKDHGGKAAYSGYATFGAGAIIVLPLTSPGHLAAA